MFYFNPRSQFEVFLITSNNFLYSTIDILSISLLSNFLIGVVWLLISLKILLNQVQKRTKSLFVLKKQTITFKLKYINNTKIPAIINNFGLWLSTQYLFLGDAVYKTLKKQIANA